LHPINKITGLEKRIKNLRVWANSLFVNPLYFIGRGFDAFHFSTNVAPSMRIPQKRFGSASWSFRSRLSFALFILPLLLALGKTWFENGPLEILIIAETLYPKIWVNCLKRFYTRNHLRLTKLHTQLKLLLALQQIDFALWRLNWQEYLILVPFNLIVGLGLELELQIKLSCFVNSAICP
jgi:hypothetical protein